MPLNLRYRTSLPVRTLLACVAGLLTGRWLAGHSLLVGSLFVLQTVRLLAEVARTTGAWLAAPLIFASIITGANGLEAMRGIGRLSWKTAAWIVGSSGVAVLIGLLLGLAFHPAKGALIVSGKPAGGGQMLPGSFNSEVWVVCLVLALAAGFYRNRLDDNHARLLLRLAAAIDQMVNFLLEWASAWIIPLAIFCLATTTAANPDLRLLHLRGLLVALAAGWIIYGGLVLPGTLLIFARLSPWRFAFAVGPAVLAALAGGSPPQVFPLTLACVRQQAGVSTRVASVALGGCTALLRDGPALGWSLAAVWMIPSAHAAQCIEIFVTAWFLGCAGAAILGPAAPLLLLSAVGGYGAEPARELVLALGAFIGLAGQPLSVFSLACAGAVIARSEGEMNLLPPAPDTHPGDFHFLIRAGRNTLT